MRLRKEIIPAILTKDLNELQEKILLVDKLVDWIHIDIMDGMFVQDATISVKDIAKIEHTADIEVHLMMFHPERVLSDCRDAGVRRVVFHIEGTQDPKNVIHEISKQGLRKGIALSPETPIEKVLPYANLVDEVMFMGVNPGKSGQHFISHVMSQIKVFQDHYPHVSAAVDGGVTLENIEHLVELGVDAFVANSSVFNTQDIEARIKKMWSLLHA